MILYFSGTGNSLYAAQVIAAITGDEMVSINGLMKSGDREELSSKTPFVFVAPTYAWRMPRVVDRFIRDTGFAGNKNAYFVLTCGSETHNAIHYAKKLCQEKGFEFQGLASVVMPENYITMFHAPEEEKAKSVIEKAMPQLQEIAAQLLKQKKLPEEAVALGSRVSSGIVNSLYYPIFVSAKGFHTTNACTGCGKCVKLCPLNNIEMSSGRPHWGDHCTQCMACICRCPSEAIEYKNKTQGKRRYVNPGYQC